MQLKQAFKDPAIIPALCAVMTGSQNPQVCQASSCCVQLCLQPSAVLSDMLAICVLDPSVCSCYVEDEGEEALEKNKSRSQRKVSIQSSFCKFL